MPHIPSANYSVDLRVQSPRPGTPEPSSRQGRRNTQPDAQLLDDDGAISQKLEACLKHIFTKYCTPAPPAVSGKAHGLSLLSPPEGAYLTQEGLDAWARDTNGAPFSQETKDELVEFLDVTDVGGLTFKGFMQIYQLQTENDEEETWRDLSNHGFDRTLTLVSTRREDDLDYQPAPEPKPIESCTRRVLAFAVAVFADRILFQTNLQVGFTNRYFHGLCFDPQRTNYRHVMIPSAVAGNETQRSKS